MLWYVSDDRRYPESKAIRACSHIDEVLIGTPKLLYSRFRRLGIYQWDDVLGTAKRRIDEVIMAFRFSRTELFERPVSWKSLQATLHTHMGMRSQVQSPMKIPESCFLDLYEQGFRSHAE